MHTMAPQHLGAREKALVGALRMLPAGTRGKMRLARALLSGARDRRDVEITLIGGERFIMPSLREPVAFHCLVNGVYEPEVVSLLRRFLSPGGVFLDVGANVGVFSVLASGIVGPSGTVVAIEASPRINAYLERNLERNGCANVHRLAKAASESGPGVLRFWPAPDEHFGMGALAPQFGTTDIEVEADTIDHLLASLGIRHVDLVKMDIEGFEAAALTGARDLLTGDRPPTLVFEFADWAERRAGTSPGAAQRVLLELGYSLYRIDSAGRPILMRAPLETGSDNLLASPKPL